MYLSIFFYIYLFTCGCVYMCAWTNPIRPLPPFVMRIYTNTLRFPFPFPSTNPRLGPRAGEGRDVGRARLALHPRALQPGRVRACLGCWFVGLFMYVCVRECAVNVGWSLFIYNFVCVGVGVLMLVGPAYVPWMLAWFVCVWCGGSHDRWRAG